MFPASRIGLFTGTTFVTASAHARITAHATGTMMEEYIQENHTLTEEVFNTINWEAIGQYMKGMSISKQVKICKKYMHNWQNTGRQKEKFAQSAGIDTASNENKATYACTFGCGHVEKNQHYLRCIKSPKYTNKMQCLKSIREWMVKSKTSKLMQVVIYMRMLDWIAGDLLPPIDICEEEGGMHVQLTLVEQDAIGWDQFFKGRLSNEWHMIQDIEYARL